ncbi:4'-phosphopantetheinyl transferase family protein [Actinobacillus suis]|uniref:4'-phosphopantetheinyl transferase n=2 Tax=Actinobacillus suis TaxID=716 RepID=K0GD50_ACTSU|nr:4'-phosphopantetheinyl transferase superfamily protein [Actinobacillus suis]AFU19630.1 4'-phosphopantetheinyl transferase [Actinobacillus suis H91-0380]AIJ31768.1 putative 4'-phosphopantetheinyl transferase [Actinobacillus suis ATCC 33415]MCO4168855.1 4'-phosphopantetheinyl transferase superfamily protein [Actinobacillus suis]MCQ9629187.1 4'-phosphopantetheinyl transferase superfamily protein [Actinobacillus suis]MCQ9631717.1 4'-phosphopantetheinyl transferase superfamily protein [Actinobac
MANSFPIIEVVFAHYDEPIPLPFLPPAELSERQLKRWKSRRTAHFLLTQLFEKYQLPLNLLDDIQRTQSGRPFVQHENIDFNISHSGEWVAVIFCYHKSKLQVGIDIEHPQKIRRYADLLRHYANAEEIEGLLERNHTPFTELADRFYLSWCLHEAVLKSQGVGIVKLSEVQHLPLQRIVRSAYCPAGTLHFYHQLPFYLCYFYQDLANSLAIISEWKDGKLQKISDFQPLVYQVNPRNLNA